MSEEQVASDLVASVTGETPNAPVLDEGAEVPAFVPLQLNKRLWTRGELTFHAMQGSFWLGI